MFIHFISLLPDNLDGYVAVSQKIGSSKYFKVWFFHVFTHLLTFSYPQKLFTLQSSISPPFGFSWPIFGGGSRPGQSTQLLQVWWLGLDRWSWVVVTWPTCQVPWVSQAQSRCSVIESTFLVPAFVDSHGYRHWQTCFFSKSIIYIYYYIYLTYSVHTIDSFTLYRGEGQRGFGSRACGSSLPKGNFKFSLTELECSFQL